MNILTVGTLSVYYGLIGIGEMLASEEFSGNLSTIMMLSSIVMFLYACLKIRHTIKTLQNPFPNECFIIIHVINFSFYWVFTIIWIILYAIISENDSDKDPNRHKERLQYCSAIDSNI